MIAPRLGEQHIPTILRRLGEPVACNGHLTFGVVKRRREELLEGNGGVGAASTEILVTVQADALPGLAVGVDVEVNDEPFTVRELGPTDDGTLARFACYRRAPLAGWGNDFGASFGG